MPEESTTPDLAVRAQQLIDAMSARDFEAIMSFYAPGAERPGGAGVFEGHAAIGLTSPLKSTQTADLR
jgi:hypothetical protein